MTPLLIHGLGHFGYGMWVLVGSLVDYYGLLDVGIRTTLQRFVARLKGHEDRDSLNETLVTGLLLTSAIAAAIFILTIGFAAAIPAHRWFDVDDSAVPVFRRLVLYLGFAVGVTLPARLLGAYLCGLQRFDLYNIAAVATVLVRAGGMLLALAVGMGSPGLGIATLASSVFLFLLNWRFVISADPNVRFHWRDARLSRTYELLCFSVWLFLTTTGDYLRSYTSALVISRFLGIALVTPYNVATKIPECLRLIVLGATGPFLPAMSELDAERRHTDLQDMFLTSTRLTALLVSVVTWLVVLNMSELLFFWLGDGFADSRQLSFILLAGFVVALAQAPSSAVLVARGAHRPLALWTIVEGIANVGLSIHWGQQYGLLGVAFGTMVPMAFMKLSIQPWYVLRIVAVSCSRYLREAFGRPFIVNVIFFGFCLATGAFSRPPTLKDVALSAAGEAVVLIWLTYAIGLTPASRTLVRSRVTHLISRADPVAPTLRASE
jgi:O-antigen/teichoic acid export membrane protein